METPWRKSLCKVVSKGEGSLKDLEPDGSTKSNLWLDAPFMSFTTLSRIVRGGVMLLQSGAVSHDMTIPTDSIYNAVVGGSLILHTMSLLPSHPKTGTHLYTWVERSKLEQVPCSRTKHTGV